MFSTPPLAMVSGPANGPAHPVERARHRVGADQRRPAQRQVGDPAAVLECRSQNQAPARQHQIRRPFCVSVSVVPVNSQIPRPLMAGGTPIVKVPDR